MSRIGLIFFAILALVFFGVGIWAGVYFHRGHTVTQTLNQSGWCCIPRNSRCEVSLSAAACDAAGGATFNWDRASCESACIPLIQNAHP